MQFHYSLNTLQCYFVVFEHNFRDLNNAGIFTYLFDCKHNQRYDVGAKRIYSLSEIK